MADPIQITLSVDAQNAAEAVNAFVEATREQIERGYGGAIEKAQEKLNALTRAQEVHKSVIEQIGTAVESLKAKKDTASQAEQRNIDQEIAKLQSLSQQRQLDITKLEEQKARVEEKGFKAIQLTDDERKQLEKLTDQRIVELGVVRSQIQAHDSVKDAVEKANTIAAAGLDKVTERHGVLRQVIEQEQQKLVEMQEAKANASGADQKRIEAGIEQQKRLISQRQDELLLLDGKRVKITEEAQIAGATSKAEIDGIRERTQALLAEIEVQRDSIKTQTAMGGSIKESASAMSSFIASAGGLIGVVGVVSSVATAMQSLDSQIEAVRREFEQMYAASEKLRNKQVDTFASTQGAFAELGITDPKAKQAALVALRETIPQQQNLTPDVIVRTAQGIGAALKAAGINDPSSSKFQDILGNASQAVYQGMDPDLVKNVFSDMLRDNPNVTGGQLNSRLADLNARAGSPRQANELMQIAQEQRKNFGPLGLDTSDIEKMFVAAGKNGIAPEERGAAVSSFIRGMDRLVGQTPQQYLELYEKMTGVAEVPGQGEIISARKKWESPQKMLAEEMRMKHLQNFGELDELFKAGAAGKGGDYASVARIMGGMSKERMEQAIHASGGPRALGGGVAIRGWNDVALPSGGSFSAPATEQETAASVSAVSEFQDINRDKVDPALASFQARMKVEEDLLAKHPEWLPDATRNKNEALYGTGWLRNFRHPISGIADNNEVAQSNVMARMFLADAKLQKDMLTGKVPSTPEQRQQMFDRLNAEAYHIGSLNINSDAHKNSAIWKAVRGETDGLPDMNDEAAVRSWMKNNVDYGRNTESLMDAAFSGLSHLDPINGATRGDATKINPVAKPLPKRPTTGPMSVNYNTKNIIYGYTGDSVSNMNQPTNNYG